MIQDMINEGKNNKTRKLIEEDRKLADQIRKIRNEKGITQEELSDIVAGSNLNYIAHIETYQRGLSLIRVYRIAKALGVQIKELFDWE